MLLLLLLLLRWDVVVTPSFCIELVSYYGGLMVFFFGGFGFVVYVYIWLDWIGLDLY